MADYIHAQGVTTESYDPGDGLIAGSEPTFAAKRTLLSGENRARGTVLGKITTGGKYKLSASASSDGSEVPVAILAHDCDATGGDKECMVYEGGRFNEHALILGAGHTIASIRDGLRALNIKLRQNVRA